MTNDSCWLLEFYSGEKLILSEKEYTEHKVFTHLICESHYFNRQICIIRNPFAMRLPQIKVGEYK